MWDKSVPVLVSGPNFSPFPFERLRRVSKRGAAIENVLARWIAARPLGARVAQLAGGPVHATLLAIHEPSAATPAPGPAIDPHAALAEVRIGGLSFVLAASSRPIRALAQRLLSGPAELDAPRPLSVAEHAIWALLIAAAIEDTGVGAEVWPLAGTASAGGIAVELLVNLAGTPMTVTALCPRELPVRLPPVRATPAWTFDVPIRIGGCLLPREILTRLELGDVITIEPQLALVLGDGAIALRAAPGAVEAEVVTGYVGREMPLADDAHLELTVQLGTTRLSLRQLSDLAPGQIISLGRPLAGPYEVRAAGRLVGTGELVDVDGELGVRIVSLQE